MGVGHSKTKSDHKDHDDDDDNDKKPRAVEYNAISRDFDRYLQEDLQAFFKGFFLNADLDCAVVRPRSLCSCWQLNAIAEKCCSGVKFRVFSMNRGALWGVIKVEKLSVLQHYDLKRCEMQIEISSDVFNDFRNAFESKLDEFFDDSQCSVLVLKGVRTTDFESLVKCLDAVASRHKNVELKKKTRMSSEGGQQFDYILTKVNVEEAENIHAPLSSAHSSVHSSARESSPTIGDMLSGKKKTDSEYVY